MSDSNPIGFLEVVESISLKPLARFGGLRRPINSTLEAVAASVRLRATVRAFVFAVSFCSFHDEKLQKSWLRRKRIHSVSFLHEKDFRLQKINK